LAVLIALGKVDQIFPKYLEHIDAALENFLAQHWPCEFVLDGVPPQCVNVRNGHSSKGHQLKNGTVFATGGYICELTFASYAPEFRIHVYTSLEGLLDKLRKRLEANKSQDSVEWLAGGPVTTADAAATEIHRDSLRRFYRDIADGGSISERFSSHTACYSCLLEPPEHTLPCGHVLCTPCVRLFGRSQDPTVIEIRECPLEGKTRHDHWPWKLHTKPKSAGVRILVLDG
jgi:hypothetical protein